MKSILRCKAHHQGDRCKKARHHDLSVQAEPDKLHVGNFAAWDENRVVARFEKKAPKRSRVANRMLRAICPKEFNPNLVPHNERKPLMWHLEQLAKHFAGGAR